MHKLSSYEIYILDEIVRYGFAPGDENDFPRWLFLERETYYWIFNLSRKMYWILSNPCVSGRLLKRIEKIPTIRFLRYNDISPPLKAAVSRIATEFDSLRKDLNKPELWGKPGVLSKEGIKRWRRSEEVVSECRHIKPDPEWRENR